jgi:hypothetical protein
MIEKPKKRRYFGGKLFVPRLKEGTPQELLLNRIEHNVEKKHLKAYLRGDKEFHHVSFGFSLIGTTQIPNMVRVAEIWR